MNHLRLTEEELQRINKRISGGAVVRENKIALQDEKRPRGLKYRNKLTETDGIKFHSKREADRYQQLKLLEKAGEITSLRRQVNFDIVVNEIKICRYVADFVYQKDGRPVTEDAKGYATSVYKIKRKLMKACHGIDVLET